MIAYPKEIQEIAIVLFGKGATDQNYELVASLSAEELAAIRETVAAKHFTISQQLFEKIYGKSGHQQTDDLMIFPESFRWKDAPAGYHSKEGDPGGIFRIPGRYANGRELQVVAADGRYSGWEHVSVSLYDSLRKKCPSWEEMCIVKNLFWKPEACVVQFHPPQSVAVNHAEVLHLWRAIQGSFPMPPKICV